MLKEVFSHIGFETQNGTCPLRWTHFKTNILLHFPHNLDLEPKKIRLFLFIFPKETWGPLKNLEGDLIETSSKQLSFLLQASRFLSSTLSMPLGLVPDPTRPNLWLQASDRPHLGGWRGSTHTPLEERLCAWSSKVLVKASRALKVASFFMILILHCKKEKGEINYLPKLVFMLV